MEATLQFAFGIGTWTPADGTSQLMLTVSANVPNVTDVFETVNIDPGAVPSLVATASEERLKHLAQFARVGGSQRLSNNRD